jgi:hypothetical protein
MEPLRFTLVGDGPTDRVLLRPLTWLLGQMAEWRPIEPYWAEPSPVGKPGASLSVRVGRAILDHPCDLLFVHRDAEADDRAVRVQEIERAIDELCPRTVPMVPHVSVVPIRMTEAWFLFDEAAIRRGAGNPNGKSSLDLPRLSSMEKLPNPKEVLNDAFRKAKDLNARRSQRVRTEKSLYLVAENITDFRPLRRLSAFQSLEEELRQVVESHGWV